MGKVYVAGTGTHDVVLVWHASQACVVGMWPVVGLPVACVPLWHVAHEPAATFWWAERLAQAVAKTPVWMEGLAKRMELDPEQPPEWPAWLSAAEIFSHWPDRLEEFLGAFQQVVKHRTSATGISRRFGLLLREAAHLEEIGYPLPANALRNYLLQHYAAGHLNGKVCLFQGHEGRSLLAKRPWITQTEAATILGTNADKFITDPAMA